MSTDSVKAQSKSSLKEHSRASSAAILAKSLGSLPAIVDFPGTLIDPITKGNGPKSVAPQHLITTKQVDNQIKYAILAVVCFIPLGYIALLQARKARRALLSGKSTEAEYYIHSSSELTALSICLGMGILVMGVFLIYWHVRKPAENAMDAMEDVKEP